MGILNTRMTGIKLYNLKIVSYIYDGRKPFK